MTKKQKKMLYRIIAALALVLVLKLLPPLPTSVELLQIGRASCRERV